MKAAFVVFACLPIFFASCTSADRPLSDRKDANANAEASVPAQRREEVTIKNRWPFPNAKNAAVITLKSIVSGDQPILYVSHDASDGGWQFLDGSPVSEENAAVVSLEEVARIDPSILELADLPPGCYAIRSKANTSWQRGSKVP